MHNGKRQVIAEKIGSTVRALELLGFDYVVRSPKKKREKGNKSPRVIDVHLGKGDHLSVYNSASGHTWANKSNGDPIADVKSIEELFNYLSKPRWASVG
jgi:hypothetical protein